MFLGHTDFQRVMSRDDFQNIRSHMKFVPPSMSNDDEAAALDPLWTFPIQLRDRGGTDGM